MEFGICTNMNAAGASKVGAEQIAFYKHCGFDYVELPLAEIVALTETHFKQVVGELRKSGIACRACNNFYPAHIRLTGEEFSIAKAVEYGRRALEKAARIGAEVVVLGSSGARNMPVGFCPSKAKEQFLSVVTKIAPLAREYNITIAIEQHNPAEGNMLNRFKEIIELVKVVDDPAIKLLFDNYHFEVVCDSIDLLGAVSSDIVHLHVSGLLNNREFPQDEAHFNELFSLLKKTGYDRTVSIEANADELFVQAPRSLEMLRRACIGEEKRI